MNGDQSGILERVRNRLGSAGAPRDLDGPHQIISLQDAGADQVLRNVGVRVSNSSGSDDHSFVFFGAEFSKNRSIDVRLPVGHGSIFVFGPDDRLTGSFVFAGWNNIFVTEGQPNAPGPVHLNVQAYGVDNIMLWSKGSTSISTTLVCQSGQSIIVDEDVMCAHAVYIRNTDNHSIVDLDTGEVLNPPSSVLIGKHVWLCQEVLVLKGSRIGAGSVIGAKSLVSGMVPERVLAAGMPAKPLRNGISWSRELTPSQEEVERIRSLF